MTTPSDFPALLPKERAAYGHARARDVAFDAVSALWRRRKREGVTLTEVGRRIGRDTGWVSRTLSAPGNWTLRTIGALVEGLDGEIDIAVHAMEDPVNQSANSDAYWGYERESKADGAKKLPGPAEAPLPPPSPLNTGNDNDKPFRLNFDDQLRAAR